MFSIYSVFNPSKNTRIFQCVKYRQLKLEFLLQNLYQINTFAFKINNLTNEANK